jgi:UDP-N-acetylmuramoylalanine--D-glutamate ligase
MVAPEHLNWHHTMDNYILAKAGIFEHQTTSDIAIYHAHNENSKTIAGYSPAFKIPYFAEPGAHVVDGRIAITGQTICEVDDIKLIGEHNWQNVCAAATVVWQIVPSIEVMRKVVTTFTGLPHRLEFVREVNGVKYYNDSFASVLVATEAAISAIKGSKVVVVGGFDRMLDLEPFVHFLHEHPNNIKSLLLIGASKDRLAQALDAAGVTNYTKSSASDMAGILADAEQLLARGDSLVFSPGYPSFDMFKDFEDRGITFKEKVNAL